MNIADKILGLDHLVIAVHDLDAAIARHRAAGFTVQPGGRHPGRTSHNALIVFADGAYIELIAWTAPAPQERWWRVLQAHGEGFVDFALLPSDTLAVLQAAQARGLHSMQGPVDGGRIRPDGLALQWRTARHDTPDLPFLCGDITARALRVPEGAARQHANGAFGVAEVVVAVDDLGASVARYRALLGDAAAFDAAADDGRSADAGAPDRTRQCLLGRTRLVLQSLAGSDAGYPQQPVPGGRGEGVVGVMLRHADSTGAAFDRALLQ